MCKKNEFAQIDQSGRHKFHFPRMHGKSKLNSFELGMHMNTMRKITLFFLTKILNYYLEYSIN